MSDDVFDMSEDELAAELSERHDLEANANDAFALLEEATALWDDLDHAGRVSRLRKAYIALEQGLNENQRLIKSQSGDEHHCPDCGGTDIAHEDIGAGKTRSYCTDCDFTLGV